MRRVAQALALLVDVGPVLVMALVIFTLSSFPLRLPPQAPSWSDKAAHFALFGGLAAALWRMWRRRGWPFEAAAAVVLTFLYGASDEFHQAFVPGRSPDWKDLLSDTLAAIVVAGACTLASARGRVPGHSSPREAELATRE